MASDPFSDILRVANVRTIASGAAVAGGPWSVRFPAPHRIKFFAVAKGSCFLHFDGDDAGTGLRAGDVFLVSARERTFVLASDLALPPVDAASALTVQFGTVSRLNAGDDCLMIGGVVDLDPTTGGILADVLPPLIRVQESDAQAPVLRWLLDQLVLENDSGLPGASLAASQLAQLMLLHILRAHLGQARPDVSNWLRAVSDPRIASTLRAIHREPARPWRLEELAKAAGMSRTAFAVSFKEIAGMAPLAYVGAWRMRLAERELLDKPTRIADLARSLGYSSESAFSNAFKRFTGKSPDHYRRGTRPPE